MGQIEKAWLESAGRRRALVGLTGLLTAPFLLGAQDPPSPGGLLQNHRRALGIDEMATAFDFEPVFFSNVPLTLYDYVAHGSDSEFTLLRNREAFGWVDIVPRKAVDVSAVNLSTELFGVKLDNPFFVAPTGQQYGTHPDGTVGMRRGASDGKTLMFVPNEPGVRGDPKFTQTVWDGIPTAGSHPFFWQFYPVRDLKQSRATLERMQANGARAIAVTCDQQAAYYPRSQHDRNLGGRPIVKAPRKPSLPTERVSKERWWYTWKYLDQIREFIKVPMIAKGILTAEDAELCIQHGLDGVYVSNHGGRALCYSPSSLEVLPEIIAAVRGRVPVLLDSGVRTGADALKALALGAKAVGVGRAARWGLGAYGAPGVKRVLEILQNELRVTLAKAGRTDVASLDHTAVRTHFV